MTLQDIHDLQLLATGMVFSPMLILLYISIRDYLKIKRIVARHKRLLAQGVDPMELIKELL